jgi:hypothetical protein
MMQVLVDLVVDLPIITHLVQELLDKDIPEELIMEIHEAGVAVVPAQLVLPVHQVVMVVMDYEQ